MPFFILGNPRSGTSMFRLMLNSHSKITVPPESGFALWFAKKYQNIHEYNEEIYQQFVADLFTAKKFETWSLNSEEVFHCIANKKPSTYPELIESVYEAYAHKQNKDSIIYGDKNNYYINHVDELINTFPQTKFVFIIRDGRDVAVSYKKINEGNINSAYKPNLPKNIEEIAEEWGSNAKILANCLNNKSVPTIYVRYEDLLDSPEETMTKVFNFLGLEYESQVLEFYKQNDEPQDFLQWKGKTNEAVDSNNKNKYKSNLTEEEVRSYEKVAGDFLKHFGYEV